MSWARKTHRNIHGECVWGGSVAQGRGGWGGVPGTRAPRGGRWGCGGPGAARRRRGGGNVAFFGACSLPNCAPARREHAAQHTHFLTCTRSPQPPLYPPLSLHFPLYRSRREDVGRGASRPRPTGPLRRACTEAQRSPDQDLQDDQRGTCGGAWGGARGGAWAGAPARVGRGGTRVCVCR